jgi:maltose O-acetyltransferase
MTEKDRMHSGMLYSAQDKVLVQERKAAKLITQLYNQTSDEELDKRHDYLTKLLGSAGKNIWIEPTFRCDYGYNIFIGDNFYANYDCIILDVCSVTLGSNVFLGPRVCIYTAAHPIDSEVRSNGLEYGRPVSIGNHVWIGGNSVINPGVFIGDNVVIGSGTVVTRDVPSGVITVGNPNRILRPITDDDWTYWHDKEAEYYHHI